MHPLTLSFPAPVETKYRRETLDRSIRQHRTSLTVAIVAYGAFAFLDLAMNPNHLGVFLIIRFAIVCPLAMVGWVVVGWNPVQRFAQPIVAAITAVAAIGIAAMIAISEPPTSTSYYAGLSLVIIFSFVFTGIRFPLALAVSCTTVASYEVAAVIAGLDTTTLIGNQFFLVCTLFFGTVAGYLIERAMRRDYLLVKMLEEESERVRSANETLEARVRTRTAELESTHRQRLELEHRLRRAEHLEALGQLAGGIAHEFNNLLMIISGATEVHQLKCPVFADEACTERNGILSAVNRGADLTHRLLAAGQRQILLTRPIAVDEFLTEEAAVIERLLPEVVHFTVSADSGATVEADPAQLGQVLLNLCINAREAMPDGGRLQLTARLVEDPVSSDRMVEITVADTGVGMDTDTVRRTFEPFFTTKDFGSGSGLGLASAHGIITQHGGTILVESSPGQGSTFTVRLPASTAEAPPEIDTAETPTGGCERILLVEDEDAVREMATAMLEHLGYIVTPAEDGPTALELVTDDVPFDLILSDLTMPGMNGHELFAEIRRRHLEIPFVLATGFSSETTALGASETAVAVVAKPYTISGLDAAVRRALGSPTPS